MAYFLKKQRQGKQIYLAIYESFYSSDTKGTKHKCYKSLGSVNKLKETGINDPIAHFQKEVDELNKTSVSKKEVLISDDPILKNLGYFPIKSLINKLDVKKTLDLFKLVNNFDYDLYTLITTIRPLSILRLKATVRRRLSRNLVWKRILPGIVK